MALVYLPIGVDAKGRWRSIDDTASGRTDLVCPWCQESLIARKGNVKAHHFSHDGKTCLVSKKILALTQLPTIDTDTWLDAHEIKYLKLLARYGHKNMFSWSGAAGALQRLEAMRVVSVQYCENIELSETRKRLSGLEGQWLTEEGKPNAQLLALFDAVHPVTGIDIQRYWDKPLEIQSVSTTAEYRFSARDNHSSLSELDQYQRFWLDAYWLKQSIESPECAEFATQRINAINQQSLYVMKIHGDWADYLPAEIIKVGITARSASERIKEVLACLKPYGKNIRGEVVATKAGAGRLERLIHKHLKPHNLTIGPHTEFFSIESLSWIHSQLCDSTIKPYAFPRNTRQH